MEKEEESLIKPSDLEDIESFKVKDGDEQSLPPSRNSTPDVPDGDPYVKVLFDLLERPREKKRESFKPFRTTVSDVHSMSRVPKQKNRYWEVTAATPPDPIHGEVKIVSLQESLELQRMQAAKLKDIQTKHAADRLAVQAGGIKMGSDLPAPSQRLKYRAPREQSESSSSSEDELHSGGEEEEDDEPGKTAVFYNFTDVT